LYALDPDTARSMSNQFEAGDIDKHYLAVARGFAPRELRIEHAIKVLHDPAAGPRSRAPVAQDAVTDIRCLATVEWPDAVDRYPSARYSMLRVNPHTGRRHQIRRHLKHISHPLIGDTTYGKSNHNLYFARRFDSHRLLLHASELAFTHPRTDQVVRIKAGLDQIFSRVSKAFEVAYTA
jgi:tRNA pseudouridine65 synthase